MGSWGGWAYNTFVMSSSRELDKEIGRTKGEKQTSNTNTHTTTTTGRRRSLESQRLLVTRSGVPYELSGCGDLTMGALESLNNYTQNVLVALEVKGVEESRLMGEVLEGLWVKLSSDLGKAEGVEGEWGIRKEGEFWRGKISRGDEWEELMRGAKRETEEGEVGGGVGMGGVGGWGDKYVASLTSVI